MNRKDYDEMKELVKSTTVKFEKAGNGFTVKWREKGCVIEGYIPREILTDSITAAIMMLKMALEGGWRIRCQTIDKIVLEEKEKAAKSE